MSWLTEIVIHTCRCWGCWWTAVAGPLCAVTIDPWCSPPSLCPWPPFPAGCSSKIRNKIVLVWIYYTKKYFLPKYQQNFYLGEIGIYMYKVSVLLFNNFENMCLLIQTIKIKILWKTWGFSWITKMHSKQEAHGPHCSSEHFLAIKRLEQSYIG